MNWSALIPQVLAILAGCGTLLKGASWLAGAWRDKANAIREDAAAAERKTIEAAALAKEVGELRTSVNNFLARVGIAEGRLEHLEGREAVRGELSAAHGIVQR